MNRKMLNIRALRSVLSSLFLIIFITLSFCSYHLPTHASAVKQKVRVGWYNNNAIQEGTSPNELYGYNYEFLQKIALYTNWEYEYVFADWDECEKMLRNGEIDLLGFVAHSQERDSLYQFSSLPAGYNTLYLVERNDTQCSHPSVAERIDGRKVATISSSYRQKLLSDYTDSLNVNVKTIDCFNQTACLEALDSGEVDFALVGSSSSFSGYRIVHQFSKTPFYFAVSKEQKNLLPQLDYAMNSIYTSNRTYSEDLFEKYSSYPLYHNQLCFNENESEYISSAAPVKVAISEDNFPMSYIGSSGNHEGFIYKFLELLTEKSGLTFEPIHYSNYSSAIQAVSGGEADIMLQFPNNYEFGREKHLYLTQSYLSCQRGLLVKEETSIHNVAIENGQMVLPFTTSYPKYDYISFDNINQCIDAVERDLADAALINIYAYQMANTMYPNTHFTFQVLLDHELNYCIGINENCNPQLRIVLDKVIGTINPDITQSYLSSSSTISQKLTARQWIRSNRYILMFLVAIAVAVILFLLVFFEQRLTRLEKQANHALAEKNKELQKANDAKSDFLSRTSHDLRTPMNAIMGLTALALDESSLVEKDFYLSQISTSSAFLLGLINDVLDMDRIENGSITLNPEPYPFKDFSQMIKNMIEPLCFKKNIEFIFESTNYNKVLLVDRIRFNQIFFNLLSNSVKYTPAGGTVTFEVTETDSNDNYVDLDFMIADTGIGMSKEFMAHMFEPFSQENRMGDVVGQSSGLGLAIVKSMVDLMGGTISVESNLNEGTINLIHLHLPTTGSTSDYVEFIDPLDIDQVLRRKNVLLVDDQQLNLEVAKKILEKKEINVTIATNGREAVDTFMNSEESFFDAVLMDIRMPVMNGLDAARAIRILQRDDALSVPIIAMTANTFDEDKNKSQDAGMNAHLGKPIIPKELFECLYRFMK